MFLIKEIEPETTPLNAIPARAVSSAIAMAWAEYRLAGIDDDQIFNVLQGVCEATNRMEQLKKNAVHSRQAR